MEWGGQIMEEGIIELESGKITAGHWSTSDHITQMATQIFLLGQEIRTLK